MPEHTLSEKLFEELRTAGLATLYFFVCFLFVIALKKLFLLQYDIQFSGLATAFFSALVVGKIVVVLDKTPAGNRFDARHPPLAAIVYKTVVYTLFALAVLAAEKVLHGWREHGVFGEAIGEVWNGRDRATILATVLCVAPAFAGYNLYSAVDRGLARGRLTAWLLRSGEEQNAHRVE